MGFGPDDRTENIRRISEVSIVYIGTKIKRKKKTMVLDIRISSVHLFNKKEKRKKEKMKKNKKRRTLYQVFIHIIEYDDDY